MYVFDPQLEKKTISIYPQADEILTKPRLLIFIYPDKSTKLFFFYLIIFYYFFSNGKGVGGSNSSVILYM